MLYFFIALGATILGGTIGIGGGMIIRPALTVVGITKDLASFTSAFTVMVMAVSNLAMHRFKGSAIHVRKSLTLAAGSIAGGFTGASLLTLVSEDFVNIGYIIIMTLVFLLVYFKVYLPDVLITRPLAVFFIGLVTGGLSGFFGIGGGPFQMAALILLLGYESKDAVVQSVFITLLTSLSALSRYALAGYADFSIIILMVPAAVVGGILGSAFNKKLTNRQVTLIFSVTVVAIVVLQTSRIFF